MSPSAALKSSLVMPAIGKTYWHCSTAGDRLWLRTANDYLAAPLLNYSNPIIRAMLCYDKLVARPAFHQPDIRSVSPHLPFCCPVIINQVPGQAAI